MDIFSILVLSQFFSYPPVYAVHPRVLCASMDRRLLVIPGDVRQPRISEGCMKLSETLDNLFKTLGMLRYPDK